MHFYDQKMVISIFCKFNWTKSSWNVFNQRYLSKCVQKQNNLKERSKHLVKQPKKVLHGYNVSRIERTNIDGPVVLVITEFDFITCKM